MHVFSECYCFNMAAMLLQYCLLFIDALKRGAGYIGMENCFSEFDLKRPSI